MNKDSYTKLPLSLPLDVLCTCVFIAKYMKNFGSNSVTMRCRSSVCVRDWASML